MRVGPPHLKRTATGFSVEHMYDYVIVRRRLRRLRACPTASSGGSDGLGSPAGAGGPDTNELVHLPAALLGPLPDRLRTGDHSTIYEPYANDRRIYLPRGKVLGGSSRSTRSSTSAGTRSTTTSGARAGPGRRCSRTSSERRTTSAARSEFHGAGGPLSVSEGRSRNPLAGHFLDSAAALGSPRTRTSTTDRRMAWAGTR
jgi:choline dehydrogenase-like flavoprotein